MDTLSLQQTANPSPLEHSLRPHFGELARFQSTKALEASALYARLRAEVERLAGELATLREAHGRLQTEHTHMEGELSDAAEVREALITTESERERLAEEVERLQSELAARTQELATARREAETVRSDAEQRIEAERAASAAADWTTSWVIAVRPPKTMSPTNSAKAGTPIAASIDADPRSSRARNGRMETLDTSVPTTGPFRIREPTGGCRQSFDRDGGALGDRGPPAGDHAQAEPVDGDRRRGRRPVGGGRGGDEDVVAAGVRHESGGGADPVGGLPVLAARGPGALLGGRDGDRAGVVVQRGLHPEEHDREQGGQHDDQLDRDRAALVVPPPT
jgi:hypothetical protein